MSLIIERAFALAVDLHQFQKRKASVVPDAAYLGHLTEVAGMVWGCFANDDPALGTTVAAALLHDAIEDQPQQMPRELIEAHCGKAVLELVLELTETGVEGLEKAPWNDRKATYLSHIQELSTSALLISVCDKLQSARELRRQVRRKGAYAYEAFQQEGESIGKCEERIVWFHKELLKAFQCRLNVIWKDLKGPIMAAINAYLDDFREVVEWLEE